MEGLGVSVTTKPPMLAELESVVDSYLSPATSLADAAVARDAMARAAAYLLWRSFGGDVGATFGSMAPFLMRVGCDIEALHAAAQKRSA
jgi:hypothetical protein